MLTPSELPTIKAFLGETKNIDSNKRDLAVVTLDDGNSIDRIGLSKKHAQRLRREFRKHGVEAFKDKRHNNKTVLLTGAQRDKVLAMLETTTPNDHGYTNSAFWSTRILATVIKGKYGVVYAPRGPAITSCSGKARSAFICLASSMKRLMQK